MKLIFIITLTLYVSLAHAKTPSPCEGINQNLSKKEKLEFSKPVATQLKKDVKDIKNAEILKSFRYKKWQILFVNTHVSDEVYLFYSGNPITNSYLTLTAGAATRDEEEETYKWVINHAKGIPPKLARCFSWHITS